MSYKALEGPTLSPEGKKVEKIVILLHGYGTDGHNLMGLAEEMRPDLPNTLFICPHGPEICESDPSARQWFSIETWEPQVLREKVQVLTPMFQAFLRDICNQYALKPKDMALGGFSQGAMTALYMGLANETPLAGVVAYSGACLWSENDPPKSRPPVLLVHGTADPVVSFANCLEAQEILTNLNVPFEAVPLPGMDHCIPPSAVDMGVDLLHQVFFGSSNASAWAATAS